MGKTGAIFYVIDKKECLTFLNVAYSNIENKTRCFNVITMESK
jgi:hypothetical protein